VPGHATFIPEQEVYLAILEERLAGALVVSGPSAAERVDAD